MFCIKKKFGKEKNYVNFRHKKISRDYIARITNQKINCMKIAKKYDYNYWDGDRKYGYGGYKYIPGYHEYVARNLIKDYHLSKNSRILDIGCGKGFLMYEIQKIIASKFIYGLDNSSYAIKNAKKEVKKNIFKHDARKKIKFTDNSFDLVISINTLHNFKLPEISLALSEMERLGKNKYMCVESFRNEREQFGAQCWALTAETIIDKKSWKWIFEISGYTGEYEFVYFN
jgi:ubiquinone/menaquinone biosynthesis C-methylase UbiE